MPPRVQSRISDHLGARAQYIWTRQFGQHYASQSLTNAADAQQKIAFRSQVAIIVDRQCDGFVDRSELAREVRDRRIGQGLSLRVDNAAVLAILPFRQARDDARSDRLQLTQPTVGLRGWCPRRGLEQFTILTNVRRIDPVSLGALENPPGIDSELAIGVGSVVTVADEPAGVGEIAPLVDRGHAMAHRQGYQQAASTAEVDIGGDDQRRITLLCQLREYAGEI